MTRFYRCESRLVVMVAAIGLAWVTQTAEADFAIGKVVNMGAVINSPAEDGSPSISADGLELYFGSQRSEGYGWWDIWVSRRPHIDAEWGKPTNLGPEINDWRLEGATSLSEDGLSLYYNATRDGSFDIYLTTRATRDDDWGTPAKIRPFQSGFGTVPDISSDGLQLYFADHSGGFLPGGFGSNDLWVMTRPTLSDPWGAPANLGGRVNSPSVEYNPCISADGLVLFFSSERPGGLGSSDVWVAGRTTTDDDWGLPVNLGPLINTSYGDGGPSISTDGRTLYFHSARPGGHGEGDLWQAGIEPILDFNGDGRVDGFELSRMADHWGTDDSACDIGPMPWGDGVVGLEDLRVLADHIGEELDDATLLAHWKLDETEGMVAHDDVERNHGTVVGTPTWLPAGGAAEGALEFDGGTLLTSDFALDPATGPFSVLVWVQGGAPGQTIVSQQGSTDWLSIHTATGTLTGGLRGVGRFGTPLITDATLLNGRWHRVAFTWDGTSRKLYVDDHCVAEDTQSELASSNTKLLIGADKDMTPGSFWTGLIDDVRIYSRAVQP